jgi:hypothetical protein
VMASDDLDNPSSSSPAISPAIPSSSLDCSYHPAFLPKDNRGYLSRPTLIHKLPRNSLEPLGSPTHPSDNSPLPSPPFLTPTAHSSGSFLLANSTHDNDPEEHDGSSSSHPHGHHRTGSIATVSSIGSSSTERDAEVNSSPLHSARSDATSTFPFPTLTDLHTTSDAGSRPSSMTSFFKTLIHRIRRPSPSPSQETDTDSDTTRIESNDGQKGDNEDVKCKGAELARPTENESPTSVLRLPPEFTDSSCLSRPSPPSFNSIPEPPPFHPTPTDPIPAEPQGSQSRVLVGLRDPPLIPVLKPDRLYPRFYCRFAPSLSASFDSSAQLA